MRTETGGLKPRLVLNISLKKGIGMCCFFFTVMGKSFIDKRESKQ